MKTWTVRYSVEGVYQEIEIEADTPGKAAFDVGVSCGNEGYELEHLTLHGVDEQPDGESEYRR